MPADFETKLLFESDPNERGLLHFAIYSRSKAAVQFEINRIIQAVDEHGGWATLEGPLAHANGAFIGGGKLKIDDGVWQ